MAKTPTPVFAYKIRPVPVASLEVPPALVTQRQLRQAHVDSLLANLDMNKFGVLVVNHRNGKYELIDGQHRYHALVKSGLPITEVMCEVYEDLTDPQMADIFLGTNKRKQVPPYDSFHVSCTAGYQRERDILRSVESNGQKISNERGAGISVVGALGKVYDRAGSSEHGQKVLGQVIRTINLGFGGDPMGFDRSVVEGLGLVFNRFDGRTNEKAMGQRLSNLRQGARELLRKAEAIRERTGNQKKHCVAAAVVDIYNKGEAPNSRNRLPSWWKAAEFNRAAETAE
jgi:hypothetical protein